MKIIRQSLRQKRRTINPYKREKCFKSLAFKMQLKLKKIQNNYKIALYFASDEEINPIYIQKIFENQNIDIYFPVLFGKALKFSKTSKQFKKNRFGIKEPINSALLNANQMDIIFMPLVGFDQDKNRIGMGGGFYDRTLAFKKNKQKHSNPKLYGLAFDCQKVKKIKIQKWDIPMDAVITPTTIYH